METKQASTFPHFIFHYTTGIQIMETLLLAQGELPVYPSVLDRYPAAGWFLAAGWGRLLKCRVGKFTLPDQNTEPVSSSRNGWKKELSPYPITYGFWTGATC